MVPAKGPAMSWPISRTRTPCRGRGTVLPSRPIVSGSRDLARHALPRLQGRLQAGLDGRGVLAPEVKGPDGGCELRMERGHLAGGEMAPGALRPGVEVPGVETHGLGVLPRSRQDELQQGQDVGDALLLGHPVDL